jgi:Nif-specific ferredoxin III
VHKGTTYGGREWVPEFVLKIDLEKCLGCGRCYKVCARNVLALIDKPYDEEEDEFGDDMGNKVMTIVNRDDCIGCGACGRTCVKKCYTHGAAEVCTEG